MRTQLRFGLVFPSIFLAMACGGGSEGNVPPGTEPGGDVPVSPGTKVTLALSADVSAEKEALDEALGSMADLTIEQFQEKTQVDFETLSYDPTEAIGLDLINASAHALTESEMGKLEDNGFVISKRQEFPTFAYGYASIYGQDLPLYVSADSILYAVHRSYDDVLKDLEIQSLSPELESLLSGLASALADSDIEGDLRSHLDIYLTVARSLLQGSMAEPLEVNNVSTIQILYKGCTDASGASSVTLFGSQRRIDFSQCKPRGHYTDSPELERYFRAMMWLGRIDMRLIETQDDGTQVFRRAQTEAALAIEDLMSDGLREKYTTIDEAVTAFVGEQDYMTVGELAALKADLGISTVADLADLSDQEIADAIVAGAYGTQRISSHYMVNGPGVGTLPLSSSFALLGQRYVVDSHVFSNVVYDRAGGGTILRLLPDPLDIAYAALNNDQAGMLLEDEIAKYGYQSDLEAMRTVVSSEGDEYWETNLYNGWLGALRALSPASTLEVGEDEALPAIAKTEAWGRRLLNTQLASWAELRHDTILYAKQSYTSGIACEFPDAYVEPYPEFFARIRAYADKGLSVVNAVSASNSSAREHFERLADAATILQEMAYHQRTGTPHSEEHMAFINQTVTVEEICGGAFADGWYPKLFYGDSVEFSPTVADVHTQPTDESGAEVGRVLHVATGNARLMVTTVETCSGPRAYAGLVSSYYQFTEDNWKRLDDPEWESRLGSNELPPEPAWMTPIVAE